MNQLIKINISENATISIPVIEYQGKKVITTELLAELFGCDENNIRKAFQRNKIRFILGKHYFELTGADLKEFKNQHLTFTEGVSNTLSIVGKNAKSLMLWTQHGTALLSKIIDTNQAWQMQEKLVDFYFDYHNKFYNNENSKNEFYQPIHNALAVAKTTSELLRLSDTSKLRMMYKICETYKVDTKFLPSYVDQNSTGSLTQLLEDFGLNHIWSAKKLNPILEELGILEKCSRKSRSSESGQKQFWSLTPKGLEFGINLASPNNQLETQPHYFRENFLKLIEFIKIP